MNSRWWYVAGLAGGFVTVLMPPITFWWSAVGCWIITFNAYFLGFEMRDK